MFNWVVKSDALDIEASAERVWDILIDVDRYGEWNPFTFRVVTSLKVGAPVDLHVDMGPYKVTQQQQIQAVEPPGLLAWGMTMGARFLMFTRREQRVQRLGEARCRYETSDAFTGLLAPFVVLLFGRLVRRGFNNVARALKERAESVPSR